MDGPTVPEHQIAPPHGDRAWIDRVIGGKYAVEGVVGRGGMGVVLKARHLKLDELVAIKVLHRSLADDKAMAARMLREARAALRLSSEHIVRVMDVDTLEEGVPYLVLEYLEGTDVSTLLRKRGGKLLTEEVIAIAAQACRALVEAHSLGIIHRDLKPANLFIATRPDGRRVLKLLDFGISKISADRGEMITRKGDILGSPRYMSPEQIRGQELDGRADLWSLGVVLYEMLGAVSPFLADNFARTCNRVLNEQHEPLASLRPDLPPGLLAAVERCLQKDRELRFPDASALYDALAPFGPISMGSMSQISLPEPGMSIPPASGPHSAPPSSGPPASSGTPEGVATAPDTSELPTFSLGGPRRRSRVFLWVALAGLAIGLAAGLAVLARGRSGPEDVDPAAAAPTSGARAASEGSGAAATAASPSDGAQAPAPNPKNAPSVQTPLDPGAGEPAGSASGAKAPPRPSGTAKPPSTDTDPFGERRQ